MNKTIRIKGLVYRTETDNVVVDYGLKDLYKGSGKSQYEACVITDESICPPLYEAFEFEQNVCYQATVLSIEKSGIRIKVNGEVGYIYFNNLASYWGSTESLNNNYKAGKMIDVRFIRIKDKLRLFAEKGVDIVPFSSFTYQEGDEVDMHIGPADEKKCLVWFNGFAMEVKPEHDEVFMRRMQDGIYYPGYPIKAKVVSVNESTQGKKFYRFSVIHEYIDYGIEIGEHICTIREVSGIKYADFDTQIGVCSACIPCDEIPADFPMVNNSQFQARVRISRFNEYGEPIVEFGSFMKELHKRHEGESFDIKLIKFIDDKSLKRVWTGLDGLFGVVAKSIINSMGDVTNGLEGHIKDGEIHIGKKGSDLIQIKTGGVYTASITEKNSSCWKARIGDRSIFIFNFNDISNPSDIMDVRVLYVDYTDALTICIPADIEYGKSSNHEVGSIIQMQIFMKIDNWIILGNGNSLGVMEVKDWDWSEGKTIDQFENNSSFFRTKIKDRTKEGILILDRHELLEDPWNKIEDMTGKPVKATIKEIKNLTVTVSINEIITKISWNSICPYRVNYGKYLFEKGSTVTLMLNEVDMANRILHLKYMPENDVDQELTFDNESSYEAEVVKLIPNGILVQVNGIYGIITHNRMLSNKQYTPGEMINVRFVKHSYNGPAHNFEFSHIQIADRSEIIYYGNIIRSANVEEINDKRITFTYNGVRLYCSREHAKYFSAEREKDFAENICKGLRFDLRVTDEQNMGVVPESMPDYSQLKIGRRFEARIDEISNDGYLLYLEDLKDTFYIPFAGFCDWGIVHYETRNEGDIVNVTLSSYSSTTNTPVFSMISGLEDPWKNLKKGETIRVSGLGSIRKKKDFYVDVNGVPVLLSTDAICCILGMPWIDITLEYSSIQKLEGDMTFEMDIISINREDYTMNLMPHIKEIPTTVRNAQIVHNRKGSTCIWVRCENNVIGRIDRSEFPEGYEFKQVIRQAVCTSFDYTKGYANLSVKALFASEEAEIQTTQNALQGITVTYGVKLQEHQIVRGVMKNVDQKNKRIFINVGPYLGIISFQDLSNMICDAPEHIFKPGKEYDFYVMHIDTSRNNLLYLSRKEFSPTPPKSVIITKKVHGRVCRYSAQTEKIVVEVEEFNGAEAVIYVSDLDGCRIGNKTRYPQIGFNLTAHVKEVHKGKSGKISQIILDKGK